jgi:hypothetical protein
MAAPAGAFVMRNASVKFAGTEYANQVSKVRFVPDTPIQTMRTLVPDGIVQDIDSTAWTLELSGIQDLTVAQGLARYLFDNEGTTVACLVQPKATAGVVVGCNVILVPAELGGEQGDWAQFEIELPVVGKPTLDDTP